MRVLIFHGYLLGGTGSNVYNARLAEALVGLGHEVHLLCQERHPEEHRFLDAAGDWDAGSLQLRELREAGAGADRARCIAYRPDIGGLLPVYVADRYEGVTARTFAQCSDEEIARYLDANIAAVQELCERVRPELALANHLVMGPAILARGLRGQVPYAVKIHGSALEYTVKPEPERFLPFAREGLAGAGGVLVGSRHTAESLWRALEDEGLVRRTRLGPPGVDVHRFVPREPAEAAREVRELAVRLGAAAGSRETTGPARPPDGDAAPEASVFARDEAAAAHALAQIEPERDVLVAFVGKLIVSKGVDLLIAAWPLVLAQVPAARLVVVGFGAYLDGVQRLRDALAAGDLDEARAIARAGRSLEDASLPARPLGHLLAFLDGLAGKEADSYLSAAALMRERVVLTGRLEHDELAELLPACRALVVPSTFPEAFGMVAAEAAACGALPVSAAHSGLLEVSRALAGALPEQAAQLLSFEVDDGAVQALAGCIVGALALGAEQLAATRQGLVATVRQRWSWEGVARGVIAAANGELDGLPRP